MSSRKSEEENVHKRLNRIHGSDAGFYVPGPGRLRSLRTNGLNRPVSELCGKQTVEDYCPRTSHRVEADRSFLIVGVSPMVDIDCLFDAVGIG